MTSTSSSSSSSTNAPPLAATKAAYAVFVSCCKAYAAQQLPKLNPDQQRLLKNTLNDYTSSVFLTARKYIRVPGGVLEAEDPSLPQQLAQVKEEVKRAYIQLQSLHHRAALLVEQTLQAPLGALDGDGHLPDDESTAPISLPPPPSDEQLDRLLQRGDEIAALTHELSSSTLPPLVSTASSLSTLLSERGSKPVSEEVRQTLTRLNEQLARSSKRGKGKATAAAASKSTGGRRGSRKSGQAAEETQAAAGTGGKIARSPSTRAARTAAQPY